MTEQGNTSRESELETAGTDQEVQVEQADATSPVESAATGESSPAEGSETPENSAGNENSPESAPQPPSEEPSASTESTSPAASASEAPKSDEGTADEAQSNAVSAAAPETTSEPSTAVSADTGSTDSTPVSADTASTPVAAAVTEGDSAESGSGEADASAEAAPEPEPGLSQEEMKAIWEELAAKKQANESIELTITNKNRGGVVSQYNGLEVFIPMSHWSLDKGSDASDAIPGETVQANVLEMTQFDTDARRVTATRRSLLRKSLLDSLEPGLKINGRVSSIMDFGVFVDLGGVDGLLHVSELSHIRGRHPNELVKPGERLEVVIREIDKDKKRISLGRKELLPSPWDGVGEKFPVESVQKGKVVGLSKSGVFVELEPGVDGFIRLRELSWTSRIKHPKELFNRGQEIEVKVLSVSEDKERVGLSYRQTQEDPWPAISEKYAIGTKWEGEVREISNKGVVVGVNDVEGFLPRGRMGREARRLPDMKAGEKLDLHVVDIDPKGHSLIFGIATQEGERSGGGDREGGRDSGGGRGGNRGGGGGGRRGDRRRDDRQMPKTTPSNEMKSAETVGNFSLGDMLGESLKEKLGIAPEEVAAEEPKKAEEKNTTQASESSADTGAEAQTSEASTQDSSASTEEQSSAEGSATEQVSEPIAEQPAPEATTPEAAPPGTEAKAEDISDVEGDGAQPVVTNGGPIDTKALNEEPQASAEESAPNTEAENAAAESSESSGSEEGDSEKKDENAG